MYCTTPPHIDEKDICDYSIVEDTFTEVFGDTSRDILDKSGRSHIPGGFLMTNSPDKTNNTIVDSTSDVTWISYHPAKYWTKNLDDILEVYNGDIDNNDHVATVVFTFDYTYGENIINPVVGQFPYYSEYGDLNLQHELEEYIKLAGDVSNTLTPQLTIDRMLGTTFELLYGQDKSLNVENYTDWYRKLSYG